MSVANYDTWKADYPAEDDECPMCGGDGLLEYECTCGEDCCCCAEPDHPPCPECNSKPDLSREREIVSAVIVPPAPKDTAH